jgi:hypothetical protein
MGLGQEQHSQQWVTVAAPADFASQICGIADSEQCIAAYQKQLAELRVILAMAGNFLPCESPQKSAFEIASSIIELIDIRYKISYGEERSRCGAAVFLQKTMLKKTPLRIGYNGIYAAAGVSGALEPLAFALKEGGYAEKRRPGADTCTVAARLRALLRAAPEAALCPRPCPDLRVKRRESADIGKRKQQYRPSSTRSRCFSDAPIFPNNRCRGPPATWSARTLSRNRLKGNWSRDATICRSLHHWRCDDR